MDSLTQIVLGAAVGEAVAGKQLGNRALLWGAIAGTIPDLDVLANPLLDTVGELTFHRSLTHSLLFAILASPLLASLLHRWQGRASWQQWFWLFFLGFVTHAILDSFTTWGTQLFWPFSRYGVAFYNIFVIDPLYTLPFLVLLAMAAFYPKESHRRRQLLWWSLGVSTSYLVLSLVFQQKAAGVFRDNLEAQGIAAQRMITKATPFNILLWSGTAETADGFYNGFYSLLDNDKTVAYTFKPKQQSLVQPYLSYKKVQQLLYVTKGYYTVEKDTSNSARLLISDMRFGQFNGWQDGNGQFVFIYVLEPREQEVLITQHEFSWRPDKTYFQAYLQRILGKE